jgi:septum formation protein
MPNVPARRPLILASTSPYRRQLLERLRIPFGVTNPRVDEAELPGESPEALCLRLAIAKARAVAPSHPDALIIGSDQVALLDGRALSKPGDHANAVAQLSAMRGRTITFLTAVAVHDAASGRTLSRVVPTEVAFRDYSDADIQRYLEMDRPYDCAGSARSEGLGIAMIRALRGDDPNALVGLPLIAVVDLLAEHGYAVL